MTENTSVEKKERTRAPVRAGHTVSDAFGAIIQQDFQFMRARAPVARDWEDMEGVHQVRVSLRRMRCAMGTFRSAIPRSQRRHWSIAMRELANHLGPARDLDVFLSEGLSPLRGVLELSGEAAFRELAEQHRASAYTKVCAMLDGDEYARFTRDFESWLQDRGWCRSGCKKKNKRLAENILPFARRVLDRQETQVLSAGASAERKRATDMHRLRIQCKKLRYASEFFTPLFTHMGGFTSHLKALQDLLGTMNDVAVMRRIVNALLVDSEDPQLWQYAGGVVGWHARQLFDVRDEFGALWAEFEDAGRPWWTGPGTAR